MIIKDFLGQSGNSDQETSEATPSLHQIKYVKHFEIKAKSVLLNVTFTTIGGEKRKKYHKTF